MNTFNFDLLRLARQAREMSQSKLSDDSGLSQGMISKIENGTAIPSDEAIEKLSKALRFPTSFFYETDRLLGLPPSVHPMYRKKSSLSKKAIEKLEADINIRLFHAKRLLKPVEFEEDLPMPIFEIDEYSGDIAKIADLVRRTWLIPSGPLKNLTDYMERSGCLIFECDFNGQMVDGVTLNYKGFKPCIFINKNLPADRYRFTLAHELGHIVMHKLPSSTMEKEANDFASYLLMPSEDIKYHLSGKVSLAKLASLKPYWQVSIAALIFAAYRSGAISEAQKNYLWIEMSKLGYKSHEPSELDFTKEKPSIITELFKIHFDDLSYSLEDLAEALRVYQHDIISLYDLPLRKKPTLRVV